MLFQEMDFSLSLLNKLRMIKARKHFFLNKISFLDV